MEKEKCQCPACEARNKEHEESEELNMAILVALVPVLTITLFSSIGLL